MTLKLIDLLEIKLKTLATSKFNQVKKHFFPILFSQKIVNKITPSLCYYCSSSIKKKCSCQNIRATERAPSRGGINHFNNARTVPQQRRNSDRSIIDKDLHTFFFYLHTFASTEILLGR
jgi:hypothetical protein